MYLRFIIFIGVFILSASCKSANIEDEISGFVIDQTVTRIGHDFARYMSDYRHANNLGDYNLTVRERPSARWGNLIWVTRNHDTVFRQFVQPSTTNIRELAENAANQIDQKISQAKLKALFSDKFDLEEDEF